MFITDNYVLKSLLVLVISGTCSILITPFVASFAEKFNITDEPNARKVHKETTPRLGGLSIFLSFIVGLIYISETTSFTFWYLIANLIIVIIGAVDDSKNLSPKVKLLGQILAAIVVISFCNVVYPLYGAEPTILAYILTFLWIIGITNAVNLSDGMDGLASTITLISMFGVFFISMANGKLYIGLLALSFGGGILGFMRYNLPNARIFMGDIGSLFMGFNASVLILLCLKPGAGIENFFYPALLMPIPIIDTMLAVIRRTRRGQNPLYPDKEHIHHILLKLHFLKNQVLIIYAVYSSIICFITYVSIKSGSPIYIVSCFIITFLALIILRIGDKNHEKIKIRRFNAYFKSLSIYNKPTSKYLQLKLNYVIVGCTTAIVLMFFYLTFPINNIYQNLLMFLFFAMYIISLHFRSVFKIKNHFTTFLSFWMYFLLATTLYNSELKIHFVVTALICFVIAAVKIKLKKNIHHTFHLTPLEVIFGFATVMILYTNNSNITTDIPTLVFALGFYYSNKIFFISRSEKYNKYIYMLCGLFIVLIISSYGYIYSADHESNSFKKYSFAVSLSKIDKMIINYDFNSAADKIEKTFMNKPIGYSADKLKTKAVRTYPYLFLENILVNKNNKLAIEALVSFLDMFPNNAEEFFIIVEPVLRNIKQNISDDAVDGESDVNAEIFNEVNMLMGKYKANFDSAMFFKESENISQAQVLFNQITSAKARTTE